MTDNYFQGTLPARMGLGREFGQYKTSTRHNEYIKYINDIWRDDQYRVFLQKNGDSILDREWAYFKSMKGPSVQECPHNYETRSTPQILNQEMQAYNSIYNMKTNNKLAPMRQCKVFKDFRLNHKY
jgi:hypothetical protein